MHVTTPRELIQTLQHIAKHPESTQAMQVNASFLRKPDAAMDVARSALELSAPGAPAHPLARKRRFLHFYFGGKPAHTR